MAIQKAPTNTKEAIIDAAVYLFYMKGYSATSIRDIAARAGGNSANIAYHFRHKQGLLEYCVTDFFEGYVKGIEKIAAQLPKIGPQECLVHYTKFCLKYYSERFLSARFVLREISVDTSLNREIYMTYLTKEKYYLKMFLEEGMAKGFFKHVSIPMFVTKLKSMLNEPFIQAQYFMEVWQVFPNEQYFINKYQKELEGYLNESLFNHLSLTRPIEVG